MQTVASQQQNQGRILPYMPGLDGLRAVAVMAVLLYHAGVSWMPGGFLGVEVFFVISGYLITALLLAEREGTGRISLGRFWMRRARRLLPALFVMLGVWLTVAAVFLPDELATLRADAAASAGYVTNWFLIFNDQSYFAAFGRPSLFQHLWSLAVEEQFYLFWPLAFGLGMKFLGRRKLLFGVLGGVAFSTILMWVLFQPGQDPSRVYYGTDTRAGGLLLGVALAFVWHPNRLRTKVGAGAPVALNVAGAAGLVFILLQFTGTSEFDTSLYQGGFFWLSLATTVVIAVAAHPAAVFGRVLGAKPLRWVGLRSYSLYLWHWPVFALTRGGQDVPIEGPVLVVLQIAASMFLAAASYRFVEMPVRNGALGSHWERLKVAIHERRRDTLRRWSAAAAGGTLTVVLVGGAVMAAESPPEPTLVVGSGEVAEEVGAPVPATDVAEVAPAVESAEEDAGVTTTLPPEHADPAASSAGEMPGADGEAEPGGEDPAPLPVIQPFPGGQTVLAVGDSVMLGASDFMQRYFGDWITVDAVKARQFEEGVWSASGYVESQGSPDIAVIHLGNNYFFADEQFDQLMGVLSDVDRVVFLTVRVNQRWQDPVNEALRNGIARHDNAELADWNGISDAQPALFYEDGTHLTPEGVFAYTQFVASVINP